MESTAQNIQDLTNVDTSFLTKLGSKNNLDSISNLLIDKVIQNIPTDHNKKPIVEISTIWDILDITMIIVVNLKNKTQISGIQYTSPIPLRSAKCAGTLTNHDTPSGMHPSAFVGLQTQFSHPPA